MMRQDHIADLQVEEIALASLPADPMAWLNAFADLPGLVFLDSARPGGALGRYSFLAADPIHLLEAKNGRVTLDGAVVPGDPFAAAKTLLQRYALAHRPDLPPFQTGLAGYFGYDLRHHLERLPAHAIDDQPFPDLLLGYYDVVVAIDHVAQRCTVMSSGLPAVGEERMRRARQRLAGTISRLRQATSPVRAKGWSVEAKADLPREQVEAMVRRTIDYIEAGDIYQANITHRFRATLPPELDRLSLYDALRRRNPATFAAYLDFGEVAVLSSSPERFLKLRPEAGGRENGKGAVVETRPIKGTRPRGRNVAEDTAEAARLLASEKDRAENLMIVDLLRNDISRVSEIGSVKVPVLFGLESYATVHHLVSVVTSHLLPGHDAVDLLRASFPGGSITGAPKIRAMEIIAELEPNRRGPYCGSIGYLGADGSMDTSIVIRTYCLTGRDLSFQVGGGIVADSDPAAEYDETLDKARALIETLRDGASEIADAGSAAGANGTAA